MYEDSNAKEKDAAEKGNKKKNKKDKENNETEDYEKLFSECRDSNTYFNMVSH